MKTWNFCPEIWSTIVGFVPRDRDRSSPTADCIRPLFDTVHGNLCHILTRRCRSDEFIGWKVSTYPGEKLVVLSQNTCRGIEGIMRREGFSTLLMRPTREYIDVLVPDAARLPDHILSMSALGDYRLFIFDPIENEMDEDKRNTPGQK